MAFSGRNANRAFLLFFLLAALGRKFFVMTQISVRIGKKVLGKRLIAGLAPLPRPVDLH
jgi:hypothetical protein